MSKTRIHLAEKIEWFTIRSRVGDQAPDEFKALDETELDSKIAFHETGGADGLELLELDYVPHSKIVVHAHDEDEIVYVISGEMHFGDKVLGPGSSVFIAGKTFYGYTAGPGGLRVVNFRPRADHSFYPKQK